MSNLVEDSDTTLMTSSLSDSAADSSSIIEEDVQGDVVDYNTMNVTDLKNLCKERGLTGYSNLTKSELVELLTRSDEE